MKSKTLLRKHTSLLCALLTTLIGSASCEKDLHQVPDSKFFTYPNSQFRKTGRYILANARLWDGVGDTIQDSMNIEVSNGLITKISKHLDSKDIQVVDVRNKFVMPGLIDTHVHLGVVPASIQRQDPPNRLRELRKRHLRSYLACGVTTVLDAGIPEVYGIEIQNWLDKGVPGPTYFFLGPMLTPNGYISEFFPEHIVGDAEQVDRNLRRIVRANAFGLKCTIEHGPGNWPIYSGQVARSLNDGAAHYGLKIYVHAGSEADQKKAMGLLNVHAFMHPAIKGTTDAHLDMLAEKKIPITTTSALASSFLEEYHSDWLQNPLTKLVVPSIELSSAKDPKTIKMMKERMFKQFAPSWMPARIAQWVLNENRFTANANTVNKVVQRHYQHGNNLVMGSDAGTWPIIPYMFHGIATLREVENLSHIGIPNDRVLKMATILPAKFLNIQQRTGSIVAGKRADILILDDSPLDDIRNIRSISYVIKNGELRTPYGWMTL